MNAEPSPLEFDLLEKIQARNNDRQAIVYVGQSTVRQVEHNRESTRLQYALADRACRLGWRREQIVVIDDDLGRSGASALDRLGFQRLVAEVGLGHVGMVIGIEVSRLPRSRLQPERNFPIARDRKYSFLLSIIFIDNSLFHHSNWKGKQMAALRLVGIAGSFNRPSKTYALVQDVADRAAQRYGFDRTVYDLHDVGPSLGPALWRKDLDDQAKDIKPLNAIRRPRESDWLRERKPQARSQPR